MMPLINNLAFEDEFLQSEDSRDLADPAQAKQVRSLAAARRGAGSAAGGAGATNKPVSHKVDYGPLTKRQLEDVNDENDVSEGCIPLTVNR